MFYIAKNPSQQQSIPKSITKIDQPAIIFVKKPADFMDNFGIVTRQIPFINAAQPIIVIITGQSLTQIL